MGNSNKMKKAFLILCLGIMAFSCSESSTDPIVDEPVFGTPPDDNEGWTFPLPLIDGTGRPFALAKDPILFPVKNIDFIADEELTAVVSMGDEIRVYPHKYLSKYESVNDEMKGVSFSMTYCPITQSALVLNRDYKIYNFVIRASGYLLFDNVILWDEATESYWSQILVECIKGPFKGEINETFNFVEMPWKTVKENFPDAVVFSNTSIDDNAQAENLAKNDIPKGDLVYGVIERKPGKEATIFGYHYDDFQNGTVLYTPIIANLNTLVVGNESDHYITNYINDSNATFTAIQGAFPVVMKDSANNYWDVFGRAVSGPRQGDQLDSHTGFFALLWAFEKFYEDFTYVD